MQNNLLSVLLPSQSGASDTLSALMPTTAQVENGQFSNLLDTIIGQLSLTGAATIEQMMRQQGLQDGDALPLLLLGKAGADEELLTSEDLTNVASAIVEALNHQGIDPKQLTSLRMSLAEQGLDVVAQTATDETTLSIELQKTGQQSILAPLHHADLVVSRPLIQTSSTTFDSTAQQAGLAQQALLMQDDKPVASAHEGEVDFIGLDTEMVPVREQHPLNTLIRASAAIKGSSRNKVSNLVQLTSLLQGHDGGQKPPAPMVQGREASFQSLLDAQGRISVPVNHQQWGNQIGERVVWLAQQSVQSAQLQIDPPELGPLQVRIAVDNDRAAVFFHSEHSSVRDALEQALPRLRELLQESGLQLADVNVSDKRSQGQLANQGQQESGQQLGHNEGHQPHGHVESGEVHEHGMIPTHHGLLDIYA